MKTNSICLSICLCILSTNTTAGQGDFFFSFTRGGDNLDQLANFEIGDSGSLFVYWSTNGPLDSDLSVGASIDVFTDNAGVIEFTAAETFDYEITVQGVPIGNRLLDAMGGGGFVGPANNIEPGYIDSLTAFTVTGGPGILESNNGSGAFLDTGYDATNDGFNWGRIDFNVVGQGSTNITAFCNDNFDCTPGQIQDPEFTTATISVGVVPEPTATGLFALGLCGVLTRRRLRMHVE